MNIKKLWKSYMSSKWNSKCAFITQFLTEIKFLTKTYDKFDRTPHPSIATQIVNVLKANGSCKETVSSHQGSWTCWLCCALQAGNGLPLGQSVYFTPQISPWGLAIHQNQRKPESLLPSNQDCTNQRETLTKILQTTYRINCSELHLRKQYT